MGDPRAPHPARIGGLRRRVTIYLKLMIDGTPSVPFSAETLAPEE
jgi:hypothetical protein